MAKDQIVFLDANVLFSSAYMDNRGLLRLWQLLDITVVTSWYAVEEARRNLKRSDQLERLDKLITEIMIITEINERSLPRNISLPPKDRPILLAAVAAKANYLITGDFKDFGSYFGKSILGVK